MENLPATARVLAARADNALRLGRLDLAGALVADIEALPAAARTAPETALSITLTRGYLALWAGDALKAKMEFVNGLVEAERALGPLARPALDALTGLVDANVALHAYDAAITAQQELTSRMLRAPDKTPRDLVDLDVSRTELLFAAGRFREAALIEAAAMPRCVASLGVDDVMCRRLAMRGVAANVSRAMPDSIRADLHVVASLASDMSSPDYRAAALIIEFRALSQLGELSAHSLVVAGMTAFVAPGQEAERARQSIALQALAEDALRRSRPSEALALLDRALQRCDSGCNRPGVAIIPTAQVLKGVALLGEGRPEDALALFQRAEAAEGTALGTRHPQVLLHSLNRAVALASVDRPAEALALIDAASMVLGETLGTDSPTFGRIGALRERVLSQFNVTTTFRDPGRPAASSGAADFFI